MDVRSAPPPRAPHIRHGRALRARRRRASSPARTRPVSWRTRGPDDVRLWPSLLKFMFGDAQDSSLADIIQAALMLRYNGRNVG